MLPRHFKQLSLTALALGAAAAQAADYRAQHNLALSVDVDSNRRLVTGGKDSSATGVDLQASMLRATEASETSVSLECQLRRYQKLHALDRQDCGVGISGKWQTERSSYSLKANETQDSELVSELTSGLITDVGTSRRNTELSLAGRRVITPLWNLDWSLADTAVRYQQQATRLLVDYRNSIVSAELGHTLTERSVVSVGASASRLSAPDTNYLGNSRGISMQWRYALTPLWRASLSLGRNGTTTRSSSANTQIYALGLQREGPRAVFLLAWNRQLAPQAAGQLDVRADTQAEFRWRFTSRIAASAAWHRFESNDLVAVRTSADRRYDAIEAAAEYQFSETVAVQIRGVVARQSNSLSAGDVDGRSVRLMLRYRPRDRSLSR